MAPADVHVVIAGKPGGEQWPVAEQLAADLEAAGVRVLLDDRDSVSPGVKFKDAELIGIPTIVVVGRGVADGAVEVRDRRSGDRRDVPIADAVDFLRSVVWEQPDRADSKRQNRSGVPQQALVDDGAVVDGRDEHRLAVAGHPGPHRERVAGQHR